MGVLRTFEQSCKNAADASQKQLLSILKDNADPCNHQSKDRSFLSRIKDFNMKRPSEIFLCICLT